MTGFLDEQYREKKMFKLNRMLLLIILSAAFCLPAMAGQEIGKITRLKGRVTIHRSGTKIGVSAVNGMELQQNDTIKTRSKAYVRFKLSDGSILTLGEKAELTLDSFTYNPEKKKRRAFFKVAFGKLRVFANRMLKYRDNRFQIQTPTAVAGVRGTVFMVWVESPTVTRIACFDSAVEVSSVFKPDEFVVLTKNILTSISKGAAPTQPVLMTEKMFKEFQNGFEGDIKPTDEETGFKSTDDSEKEKGRKVPYPKVWKEEPPEVLDLPDETLEPWVDEAYTDELYNEAPEIIETVIEPHDLEPPPEQTLLPEPPAEPAL